MSDADKLKKILALGKDDERQMMQFGPQIADWSTTFYENYVLMIDRNFLEERFVKLETLAKDIIMKNMGDF